MFFPATHVLQVNASHVRNDSLVRLKNCDERDDVLDVHYGLSACIIPSVFLCIIRDDDVLHVLHSYRYSAHS